VLVSTLALGCVFAAHASGQEIVVRGVVIGPDGSPLAIDRVVLHRVDSSGGATVAQAATGADGRFVLNAPAARDTAGVYFVAARYQEELYIGQPFRPAMQGTPDQVLQVGVAANSASALLANAEAGAPAVRRARRSRNAFLFIVPLVIAAAAVFYLIVPRRRIAPRRAMLIRLAEIDERLPDAPQGQRDSLRDERTRLVDQLRAG
jgi:hypothetical protein